MQVLSTERLRLRWFDADKPGDAEFILELLNEPSWLQNIGDRNVHSLDAARAFITDRLVGGYWFQGFGFWAVERLADGALLGMCGLIKRDSLPHVDVGYGFVPRAWGAGYAREAAAACLRYGHEVLGLNTILGITSPSNTASARVLEGIGLRHVETTVLDGETRETALFRWDAPATAPLDDIAQIELLLHRVLGAFDNRQGAIPLIASLPRWLLPHASIACDRPEGLELMDPRTFIKPRAELLFGGRLSEFTEGLHGPLQTELLGRIAQLRLRYRKSGVLDGQAFEGSGEKRLQVVKTADGWRVAALAWCDDVAA
ncbi:GNAT family N-acetyltransferase [Pelomonas sp. V22]|uniref:GNAT family N-acetyltransferase n=1 Tax=Pelomonas sp. V22 TaxID=2822139 RepID=UPI0024A9E3F2|nr:GNAT family N-acetyltransferase [Pelomonas sp. V22]MDI4634851.1 GNAT family N-acetyltransferase [Pelomonas sp. V22]